MSTPTVSSLRPDQKDLTLTVKVVDATTVVDRGSRGKAVGIKVAECLVADSTGIVVFVARNEQVDLAQKGATITLKGAKVDMFRGSMRLSVDAAGKVEIGGDLEDDVNTTNNMSLLEFELVTLS
ncbi:hypothetical protein TSOC_010538 [Tetrabaena socialis]|uniref:Single-stranded DNA binding protein Ssb-like OB fold domain-containing protein n=1 Tax=Tetrabaena socialis TaxID=47790 RepID=A0A2J7ZT15_9CHLO|nr:hypothetical protein TSOC_010538 [Tetrabaena socialis]|eukprot:PNH03398.1 hypothetical protein TSOC_010538 [Tetrabaena socialis]